ncbi:MAG: hypothetical protein HY247_04015 [archaeon]|nr:MAG: hypothetical protein HY247_04015 [archaeon]
MKEYWLSATLVLFFLLPSVPIAGATDGSFLSSNQVGLHGPLVDRVVISVYTSEAGMLNALSAGSIQAPEWSFSTGGYATLASQAHVIEGATVSYSYFSIAFNTLKFPGSSVHFRRAIQYMQDYSLIQSTILNGVEGVASPDVLPCAAYSGACNPMDGTNSSVKFYPFDLDAAGQELIASGVFCGNCGAGNDSYDSSTTWWTDAAQTQAFSPNLWIVNDHHRYEWGSEIVNWAGQIGLQISAHTPPGRAGASANCYGPNSREVMSPGSFQGTTGANAWENTPQHVNSTQTGLDLCDMYTKADSPGPEYYYNMEQYNSQFSGTPVNMENFENQTLNVATSHVMLAPDQQSAERWARNFAVYYSQQVPTVMGYFENQLFANNVNGWTGFAQIPTQSPNDLAGLYYSLLNVHRCGPSSCELNATGGGRPGGTLNLALEHVADQGGLNPLYGEQWGWQTDVWRVVYDVPMLLSPDNASVVDSFLGYMVSSFSVSPFSGMTPAGKAAFDYQAVRGLGQHISRRILNGQEIRLQFLRNITFSDGIPMTALDYLKYFDLDHFSTSQSTADTTQPLGPELLAFAPSRVRPPPRWVKFLNNLEVGSGPFTLGSWDRVSGTGELDRSPTYFRSAWDANLTSNAVQQGTPYVFRMAIQMRIFNPLITSYCGVAPGETGLCTLAGTNPGQSWARVGKVLSLFDSTGHLLKKYSLVKDASISGYNATISTTHLAPGDYKLLVQTIFTFQGLRRTWIQVSGFTVEP